MHIVQIEIQGHGGQISSVLLADFIGVAAGVVAWIHTAVGCGAVCIFQLLPTVSGVLLIGTCIDVFFNRRSRIGQDCLDFSKSGRFALRIKLQIAALPH